MCRYSFFLLFKAIATAIILAAVFAPVLNGAFVLGINVLDSIFLILYHPNTYVPNPSPPPRLAIAVACLLCCGRYFKAAVDVPAMLRAPIMCCGRH